MKILLTLGAAAAVAAGATNDGTTEAGTAPVTGTVTGRVVFEGEMPEIKPLTISADQAKGCTHGDTHVDDKDMSLVVSDDGGIQYVAVTMEVDGADPAKAPEEPVILDQKGCRFVPHMIVVPVGTTVSFANSDDVSHNIHTYPIKNTPLNQTVAAGGALEQKMEKAEEVKVGCDIHPWMTSYVVVTEATHFAVTDASGAFSIEGVPPGKHTIEFWHEKGLKATATVEVEVAADGSSAPVEVKMGEKKRKGRGRGR